MRLPCHPWFSGCRGSPGAQNPRLGHPPTGPHAVLSSRRAGLVQAISITFPRNCWHLLAPLSPEKQVRHPSWYVRFPSCSAWLKERGTHLGFDGISLSFSWQVSHGPWALSYHLLFTRAIFCCSRRLPKVLPFHPLCQWPWFICIWFFSETEFSTRFMNVPSS